jgi:hypothetical protein
VVLLAILDTTCQLSDRPYSFEDAFIRRPNKIFVNRQRDVKAAIHAVVIFFARVLESITWHRPLITITWYRPLMTVTLTLTLK